MSTTRATQAPPRKPRWYQFSLRTTLALTSLTCLWLAYQVRQHQAEQTVAESARATGAKVDATWRAPAWWQQFFGDQPAGIFQRIEVLSLNSEQLSTDKLAQLSLNRLTSLQDLVLANTEIWDEDAEALRAAAGGHFRIHLVDQELGLLKPITTSAAEYRRKLTPATKSLLRRSMLSMGHFDFSFVTVPDELSYGCFRTSDSEEETALQIMRGGDEELAVLAARALWRLRSRMYAAQVIDFCERLQPQQEHSRQVIATVADSIRPENIRNELETGRMEWGSWLAALRPHPSLIDPLIAAVDDGRATLDTVYALGKSNDPRVVPTLVKVLSSPKLSANNVAIKALVPCAGESLETRLIAGLDDGNEWFVANAGEILAETGTARSLAKLRQLKDDPKFAAATINVSNVLDIAINAIEARELAAAEAKDAEQQAASQQ